MDAPGIRTSFIPKQSLSNKVPTGHKEGMGFLTFLGITVLVVSLFGWLAAYGYRALLEKEVADQNASLELAKQKFDPSLLKVFENLERRLNTSSQLLAQHTTLSPLFDTLDQLTLKSVRYTAFNYTGNQNASAVKITGEALNFPAVALQALAYSKDSRIINPIFSNLAVEASGRVTFDVAFTIDQNLVLYAPKTGSKLQGL
ncbi:MAG TPA: hypothetical protein VJG48_00920 [Candidatus Paceibacterota bacterium]